MGTGKEAEAVAQGEGGPEKPEPGSEEEAHAGTGQVLGSSLVVWSAGSHFTDKHREEQAACGYKTGSP